MSWKAIAITLMALLVLAVIGAAGLVIHVQQSPPSAPEVGQPADEAEERRQAIQDSIWRDFDKPYRTPSGELVPDRFPSPGTPRQDQPPETDGE